MCACVLAYGQSESPGGVILILIVAALVVLAKYYRPQWAGGGFAHGTARWSTEEDLRRAGMLGGDGLVLGRSKESGKLIRLPRSSVHLSIYAPPGAGKSVSLAIPWLLDYRRGSVVVNDPKGELFNLTSEHRRRALGHKVVRLDPYGVCGPGGDTWNVLDVIDGNSPLAVDDCRAVADALVQREMHERERHFNDRAVDVFTALLALITVRIGGDGRSLCALRQMVTDPVLYKAAGEALREDGSLDGLLRGLGNQLLSLRDKEESSVLSTCARHSTFLDSLPIRAVTGKSSFDVRELLGGRMTIYLVLPPAFLASQARWLRAVFASIIRLVGKEGMARGKELLLLIDEAGQIGRMEPIEQGLTLLRSYGLKLALFYQSIGQLKEAFPEKESVVLDSTETIWFGTSSIETAERVSKMLGTASITVESGSTENESRSYQQHGYDPMSKGITVNRSCGLNRSEISRELMKPEEVLAMSGGDLIAFIRGVPPIMARRVKWFRDRAFARAGKGAARATVWLTVIAAVAAVAALAWALAVAN